MKQNSGESILEEDFKYSGIKTNSKISGKIQLLEKIILPMKLLGIYQNRL